MNLKSVVGMLLLGLGGMSFSAWGQFESKQALFQKLNDRGFDYVIEMPNNTLDTHYHYREHVVDLSTGKKHPHFEKRLEKMDYYFQPKGLIGNMLNPILAKAYNVSDVMVCYFLKSHMYRNYQTCLIFPHSVDEVVRAISS